MKYKKLLDLEGKDITCFRGVDNKEFIYDATIKVIGDSLFLRYDKIDLKELYQNHIATGKKVKSVKLKRARKNSAVLNFNELGECVSLYNTFKIFKEKEVVKTLNKIYLKR